MTDPLFDLDVNTRSQLAFLEALRWANPGATVVFTSTRQLFGKPRYLPVDEEHPVAPVDVNGITKHAAEQFHLLYGEQLRAARRRWCGSPTCSGPASACATTSRASCRSSSAARCSGQPISLFGDGVAGARLPLRRRRRRLPRALRAHRRCRRRGVQRRQRRAPVVACDRRPHRRGGRVGVGRDGAVAARSRRDRHRLVLRRLVEGEAGARAGVRRPRSPTASSARSRSTVSTSSRYL